MHRYLTSLLCAMLVVPLLGGCPAYYGGTEVTTTDVRTSGALEVGSIRTLAVAPVMIPDDEGSLGDVDGLTLDAYNKILRAVEARDTMQFKVLTPFQFGVTLDQRMTEHERETALLDAARRAGASHVFVLGSSHPQGEFGFSQAVGLAKPQGTVPVSVKVLETDTRRTIWSEDFNTTVKFGLIRSQTIETEARRHVVDIGVNRFLGTYGH